MLIIPLMLLDLRYRLEGMLSMDCCFHHPCHSGRFI